jgi:threonine dehydratase
MARSWRAGRAVECDVCDTIADGLAVRVAIPGAVDWLRETADDMLEVSESEIAAAVVEFDDAGVRAEAAAAAALAALPKIEADGPIVLVVTGRNIDDELLARCRAG